MLMDLVHLLRRRRGRTIRCNICILFNGNWLVRRF